MYPTLLLSESDNVLTISLNRPNVRNAFNDEVIADLTHLFKELAKSPDLRMVILKGEGDAFSAGADLEWMKKAGQMSMDENRDDALKLARMLELINQMPVPIVGLIHGYCFGGGLGLAAVCDYVLAAKDTLFSFSEVKLGLIPAVIGPFVLRKIGVSMARALFISAERFDAQRAMQIRLVHQVLENKEKLGEAAAKLTKDILSSSPQAVKAAKKFLQEIPALSYQDQITRAANTLSGLRGSEEAREGLSAFLEKRKPNWIK